MTLVYRAHLMDLPATIPAGAAASAQGGLATARTAALALPDHAGTTLLTAAQAAFTSGIASAAMVSAIALAIVAVAATVAFRRIPPIMSR